ncbi:MAG: hypothetical protein A2097_04435 [Desulfobacula sp. GWF2_41_7]|nr:MAG: hypothetical protein A2097_04435 [Desulfobacula sp. GWF2_41_7]
MADWIYCGTDPPVDANGTQYLLHTHHAIWCSPPGLRPWPGKPRPGDRLWLLWRDHAGGPVLLLGGGRLAQNSQNRFGTDLLHTNTDIPGVRDAAQNIGYGGGMAMSFLRLVGVTFPTGGQPDVHGIGPITYSLSVADASQSAVLNGLLRV